VIALSVVTHTAEKHISDITLQVCLLEMNRTRRAKNEFI